MPIDVFPVLLRTLKCICDIIRSYVINYNNNLFKKPKLKNLKSIHVIFSSTKYSILPNFQSSLKKKMKKKIKRFDFRGIVWFRGGGGGRGNKISLNCYNWRNICHNEEQFSVLKSPSHALSDDIFGGLKLENLYTTFL